jgi:DNA-binding response OmpR family regulator
MAQEPDGAVKTILLVEDDVNIGEVFSQAITQETPYLVILANDGMTALEIVKNIKPNLFILDYQLPKLNGIQLYDRLHAIKEFEHVPAIMMSASLPYAELEKRNIVGLNKPIDLDVFLQTIERLIESES